MSIMLHVAKVGGQARFCLMLSLNIRLSTKVVSFMKKSVISGKKC